MYWNIGSMHTLSQRYVDPECSEELYQLSISDAGNYKVFCMSCSVVLV